MAQQAFAADLPRAVAPPAYRAPVAVPVFSWTGCYIGGNAGGHFGRDEVTTSATAGGTTTALSDNDRSGFIGGGQIGCNMQSGMFVGGIEGDIQWLSGNTTVTSTTAVPGSTLSSELRGSWLGTVRGRAGVAFDRVWLYGTGGVAFGNVRTIDTITTGLFSTAVTTDSTRTGWTAGAGIEFALSFNWTAKAEYLYVDLGDFTSGALTAGGRVVNHSYTTHIGRVGLNYKF